jgi:rhodanese-related sulfurtransferase
MKLLARILLLLALAGLLAGGRAAFLGERPSAETDAYAVSPTQALAMEDVLWVDGRPRAAFVEASMPGAVHLGTTEDAYQAGLADLLPRWDPVRPVVVYCDGEGCKASRELAGRLRSELGVENILWVEGGWTAIRTEAGE